MQKSLVITVIALVVTHDLGINPVKAQVRRFCNNPGEPLLNPWLNTSGCRGNSRTSGRSG